MRCGLEECKCRMQIYRSCIVYTGNRCATAFINAVAAADINRETNGEMGCEWSAFTRRLLLSFRGPVDGLAVYIFAFLVRGKEIWTDSEQSTGMKEA